MSATPTILIIDDEATVRHFLEEFLSQEGYLVTVAHDGQTGLAYLADQYFDAVLIDLVLPDMAGLKIIHNLRDIAPETTIIALTGWLLSDAELVQLRPYVYDYLTKPFALPKLRDLLHQALRGR